MSVLQCVKSASILSDPDSNPDAARLGVQTTLSANTTLSGPFHPKAKQDTTFIPHA